MNMKKLFLLALFVAFMPSACFASLKGTKADDVKVKVYFKRSPEWKNYVKMIDTKTDSKGVLKSKKVPEGWYKIVIDKDDVKEGQAIATKMQMLDKKGRYVKNAKVNMYVKIGDSKVFVGTKKTDKKGWIENEGVVSGQEVYLEVDADKDELAKFSKKDNQPRIKAMTKKVGKSKKGEKWLQGLYARTDENQTLDVGIIREGYTKFAVKKGDVLPNGFFNIKGQVVDSKFKAIKKPTEVMLYVFPQGQKVFAGKVMTGKDGEIFLPKTIPGMKYQMVVVD